MISNNVSWQGISICVKMFWHVIWKMYFPTGFFFLSLSLSLSFSLYLYVYIYIYQMDCVCQRYHKECSTRTYADDCYNCWKKVQTQVICTTIFSWMIPIARQSVNHKKILWVIHKQQKNYIENHKNTPQSIKKTCYNIKCTYKYHFTSSV